MNKICVTGFDTSGGLPIMAMHTFSILSNGNLLHEIDGKERAEVPPDGFEAYAESWPDCVAVLSQRVFDVAIDPMKDSISDLASVIHSDPADDKAQIAYLQGELAKLTALQDNIDSGSPASSEADPPASPGA